MSRRRAFHDRRRPHHGTTAGLGMSADSPLPGKADESYVFAYAAWVTAMVATLASLFFGEVMKLPPCTLCWYQRICLFPLTLLIAAGIVLRDKNLAYYTLPL